eukprot:15433817-Alexandrium_andersonii.AAC.1
MRVFAGRWSGTPGRHSPDFVPCPARSARKWQLVPQLVCRVARTARARWEWSVRAQSLFVSVVLFAVVAVVAVGACACATAVLHAS